jgi:hypothetical protein
MRHIKNYKMFENLTEQKLNIFLDILRSDVFEYFGISEEDVTKEYNTITLNPAIEDDEELKNLINTINQTWERTLEQTGLYPHCKNSGTTIIINLLKYPTIYVAYRELGLDVTTGYENGYSGLNNECGVLNGIDQAVEAIEYLNRFYGFAYRSDIEPLRKFHEEISKRYKVKRLLFSIERFTDELYQQYVAVIFDLEGKQNSYNPIYVIDSKRTDSPYVWIRHSRSSWNQMQPSVAATKTY